MLTQIVGSLAMLISVVSTFPQVYQVIKNGHAAGLSLHMLMCWSSGLFLMLFYVILDNKFSWILGTNYIINGTMSVILLCYRLNNKTKSVMKEIENVNRSL